ncbi:hypothetical protein [Streptomyces sp. 061-3]|uniref:hypothetical protein n=1 Tax=Streptomyces sp. 061-3 TaxID=2789268 RepID=UPI00397F1B54
MGEVSETTPQPARPPQSAHPEPVQGEVIRQLAPAPQPVAGQPYAQVAGPTAVQPPQRGGPPSQTAPPYAQTAPVPLHKHKHKRPRDRSRAPQVRHHHLDRTARSRAADPGHP